MIRLDATARGVFVIAPTPFAADGALDLASTDRMVDRFLAAGATGMTILGIMGEAPKLDAAEAEAFVARVLRRIDGRIPVVVGVSAPGLAPMRALTRMAMDAGAAGVMVAPTPGLKGDDGILGYFGQVVNAIGEVPWVLQDYPQANGVFMGVGVIRQLIERHAGLVMVKAEDWPGLDKITALRRLERDQGLRRVSILGGNSGMFLPEEIARGADGIMTGYAVPEMLVRVCDLMGRGEHDAAMDLFDAHLPLVRHEFQPGLGLAVRKYVLAKRGIIADAALRAPAPALSAETRAEIDLLLARIAVRDPPPFA